MIGEMDSTPDREVGAADDAWRLMLDCSLARFGRASEALHHLGLTPGHMKLLLHLEEGDGRAMGSLAQSIRCDASTMTWLVDRLEERGLVERQMLPTDRRVKAVALTPLGVQTKQEITERLYEPPEEIAALPPEVLEQLRDALAVVRDAARPTAAATADTA
jgi:DNA-binding MarR family transcriptional regulator